MSGSSPANPLRVPQGPHPSFPVPIFKHIHQKQNLRKSPSHILGSHRRPGQRKRPLRHYIPDADRNRSLMFAYHEKRPGPFQNSSHLHHPENPLRLKRPQLHLRHSLKILRSVNSPEQHAEITDRQQQRRPPPYQTHHEMLQPPVRKQPSLPSTKQEPAHLFKRTPKKFTRRRGQEVLRKPDEKLKWLPQVTTAQQPTNRRKKIKSSHESLS